MPNAQRDAGHRAELEACRLLEQALGLPYETVRRRASDGTRLDVGDLVGIDDVTVQVTRIGRRGFVDLGRIAQRARRKAADCTTQQSRRDARHGVVLLRLDGVGSRPARWRAIVTFAQLVALDAAGDTVNLVSPPTQGLIIRDMSGEPLQRTWIYGEPLQRTWIYAPGPEDLWVSTLDGWARTLIAAARQQPRLPTTR